MVDMATFKLNDYELKKANEFKEKHMKEGHMFFSYQFRPTGIGIGVDIVCDVCGEKEDITDYASW